MAIKKITTITLACLLTGCASNPNKIDAAYVSPLKYKDYDCDQIALEMDSVGQRTTKLYTRLQSERTKDNAKMGAGLLIFWPSLFLLSGGDGPETAEYAQLKGEYEALRENSIQKKCAVTQKSLEQILKEEQDRDPMDRMRSADEDL